MSASYSAVGWNRQKKMYDLLIAGFCLSYLAIFIVVTLVFNPQVTAETLIIRCTSTLAILLLHVILAIGPLCRLNKRFLPLLYNRRHLGVTMFLTASIHGVFSIFQFHALSNTNVLISLFTSNTNFTSLPAFPFQLLGFMALMIFLFMAATSHDFWLHNLSPRVWKGLHMFVYLAYVFVVLHIMLGVIQYESNPLLVVFIMAGVLTLGSLHILAARKERKKDSEAFRLISEGYVFVCTVPELIDSRAKIFCVSDERIAVYRHKDKIYAVHNVCKHQGGPLGEGKILDGCITCPWHGYQYYPHNGQSPPPFKEKVSTYDVKIMGDKIWLNPVPYAEGTERPGCAVNA